MLNQTNQDDVIAKPMSVMKQERTQNCSSQCCFRGLTPQPDSPFENIVKFTQIVFCIRLARKPVNEIIES